MKVIVDAYNVLHQMRSGDIREADRKAFINKLAAYGRRKRLEMVVVFDAGPFLFPSCDTQKGIVVRYSGSRMSADDLIIKMLRELKGQEIVLVSSDRELRDAAKSVGLESLGSVEFIERLHAEDEPEIQRGFPQQAVKMHGTINEEVDRLMEQVRVANGKHEDALLSHERKPDARRASKQERKRWQKIKKL